jgi:hypothetical protein
MFTAAVHEIKATHRVFLLGTAPSSRRLALLDARELYSEDMSHGQEVEGVVIVSPFR